MWPNYLEETLDSNVSLPFFLVMIVYLDSCYQDVIYYLQHLYMVFEQGIKDCMKIYKNEYGRVTSRFLSWWIDSIDMQHAIPKYASENATRQLSCPFKYFKKSNFININVSFYISVIFLSMTINFELIILCDSKNISFDHLEWRTLEINSEVLRSKNQQVHIHIWIFIILFYNWFKISVSIDFTALITPFDRAFIFFLH